MKLYRARNKARGEEKVDHAASYAKLSNHCHMVLLTNQTSLAIIHSIFDIGPIPMFQRCFIYLEGAATGFLNGYRPFIGFDGCHLKGPYGGILLLQ